ncbi:MAG: family transporter [Bacteroidetes bacterium]|jgi:predicted PurR-regulated permease PerM|nr:family transporter [Bacteroidota bacterium]
MVITSASTIKKLLILFLVCAGLYYAKEFLIPLSIGAILATLFLPFCKWLEGKKISRGLAVTLCLVTLLLAIGGIGALLGWQIAELMGDFTLLKQKIVEKVSTIQQYIFKRFDISVQKQWSLLKDNKSSIGESLNFMLGSLAKIVTGFILILVYIAGFLYYRNHIKDFLIKLSKPAQREEMEQVVYKAAHVSQQYLLGLTKMIICLWIMYGLGFTIVGVKNALFFAVLCGLLEIIPFIGNITGTTITILVAAVQGAGFPMLGGIVLTYGIVQFIQGWVLEPFIVGPQVKINPLFIIIALVVGELVWGIPGIFMAIPIIAMCKIVCDHIESLKPYGFLIGEVGTAKRKQSFMNKIINWIKKKRRR